MSKNNLLRRTIMKYILLVALFSVMLFPARYVNTIAGYFGVCFLVVLLILSILSMQLLKRSISIDAAFQDTSCVRGEKIKIGLNVENRAFIIAPKASTVFFISDLFGKPAEEREITFLMGSRSRNDFGFRTEMSHVGIYTVGINDLAVSDMFGFFRIRIPIRGEYEVAVLPRLYELENLMEYKEAESEEHSDGMVQVGGMDYAGVREYERGDSMKQIHWKLSAHSHTYYTKLTESSRKHSYVVILDFAAPHYVSEELMDVNDCLIETALSAISYLAKHDENYSIVYADRKQEIHRKIPFLENPIELIREFDRIFPETDSNYPDAAKLMEEEGQMPNRSSNVIICTSRVTEDTIQEILNIKRQRRFPELYFIIPERMNSRERELLVGPLAELDDMGIPYHVLSTQINRIRPESLAE